MTRINVGERVVALVDIGNRCKVGDIGVFSKWDDCSSPDYPYVVSFVGGSAAFSRDELRAYREAVELSPRAKIIFMHSGSRRVCSCGWEQELPVDPYTPGGYAHAEHLAKVLEEEGF